MPVDLNTNNKPSESNETTPVTSVQTITEVSSVPPVAAPLNTDEIYGLSTQEIIDPNQIVVTLANPNIPIVVLYGPPACGKTMTLVRLTRFLRKIGYTVAPVRSFRPAGDTHYSGLCDNFNTIITNNNAAAGTDHISFMLVDLIQNGKSVCQILEAPGEFYFKPGEPNRAYPAYVNNIIACNNRKVWSLMIEPDWLDQSDRNNYVHRITDLKSKTSIMDRVVFVYNKIDKTHFVRSQGKVNVPEAIDNARYLYPGIFNPFMNQNPITKFWRKYNCNFVPFQTGTYTETVGSGVTFQQGPDSYCENLWKALLKEIYG